MTKEVDGWIKNQNQWMEDYKAEMAEVRRRRKEGKMYVDPNFKTKKALKEAIAAGKHVSIYSPGPFPAPTNGRAYVEGPHYPQPHTWYAEVDLVDGEVVKVK